nr:LOW QUALITY PROTEIN: uncharacterized protein LOC119176853 [Rhipicephalus microplus]
MGPFLASVLATITYVPCAVLSLKAGEVFVCDYNDEQIKAVISCYCAIYPQEDLDLMIAARYKTVGNTTFELFKRFCKRLPAVMYHFIETAKAIGYMMAICQNATLYHLPLKKKSPK